MSYQVCLDVARASDRMAVRTGLAAGRRGRLGLSAAQHRHAGTALQLHVDMRHGRLGALACAAGALRERRGESHDACGVWDSLGVQRDGEAVRERSVHVIAARSCLCDSRRRRSGRADRAAVCSARDPASCGLCGKSDWWRQSPFVPPCTLVRQKPHAAAAPAALCCAAVPVCNRVRERARAERSTRESPAKVPLGSATTAPRREDSAAVQCRSSCVI